MKVDIQKYIQGCLHCQLRKSIIVKTKNPMVITDTPTTAFEEISMDIVGQLPEKKSNYKRKPSKNLTYKGFSNRDITIFSMNKTQKYLDIELKFIMGVVQALHFMNKIRFRSYDHHEPVYSGRFFGPNFPPLWHTF